MKVLIEFRSMKSENKICQLNNKKFRYQKRKLGNKYFPLTQYKIMKPNTNQTFFTLFVL